ncbi:MAG: recombinase zinc beta ribbon domain-containing protein [Anaerolineae bacterium]|nr:recombinase zinc beta ribbon domain-containing protein [Anaerolineae bacterium]
MGELVYNNKRAKQPIVIAVPPLVDKDTWDRAQRQRRENFAESKRNRKHDYLFAGLIKCGTCGLTYVGCKGGTHNKSHYYRCGGKEYTSPHRLQKCQSAFVRADILENAVCADIHHFALNPGEVLTLLGSQSRQGKLDAAGN